MTIGPDTTPEPTAPIPRGRYLPQVGQSLFDLYPAVAAQWDYQLNGGTEPAQISARSNVKRHWRCEEGPDHRWEAATADRTKRGNGCPFCSGRRASASNNLGVTHPLVAALWDQERNGDLRPEQVTAGSSKKIGWICPAAPDHRWEAVVGNQTTAGVGCPFCSGRRPSQTNNLRATHPAVAAQWDCERNGDLRPEQVTAGSNQMLYWICDQGEDHRWATTANNRTGVATGCPFCSGRKASAAKNLTITHPAIAAQWDHDSNGGLGPEQVSAGSARKVRWICAAAPDHRWAAQLNIRTIQGSGCPFCAGQRPSSTNNLAKLRPALARQWDSERNGDLQPEQVTSGASQMVHWRCENGSDHRWAATVNNRTSGHGCPFCLDRWTMRRVVAFLRSKDITSMPPSHAYAIIRQADGLIGSANGRFVLGVISGREKLPAEDEIVDDPVAPGHSGLLDRPPALLVEGGPEGAGEPLVSLIPTTSGASAEPATELAVISPDETDDADESGWPEFGARQILEAFESAVRANGDSETVEFFLADDVSRLWRTAYAENMAAIGPAPGESVLEIVSRVQPSAARQMVADRFLTEYRAAVAIKPPAGWSFQVAGVPTLPNVMQQHFASLVLSHRRVGNWSGTGAGKTISAILAARLTGAGLPGGFDADPRGGVVIVVCPNNTVGGWTRAIAGCYPDSRIVAKNLTPTWAPGSGPRWLLVNFDSLQTAAAQKQLAAVTDTYRVDMLVVDEVHFIKHRNNTQMSRRRQTLLGLATAAGATNPDLKVLGMSATPVVNDLHEARSLLEIITGLQLDDLPIRPTVDNALKVHEWLTRTGVRWLPDYPTTLAVPLRPEVEVSHLTEEILQVRRTSRTPLALEQVLLTAKLPMIVKTCMDAHRQGRKTLVYTEFVDGIADVLLAELQLAGLRVGLYTGADKTGLDPFLGSDRSAEPLRKIPAGEQVDVLIGTSTIGTGVDGLQDVADLLIFATLPWTSAAYTQIIGRLWRQGQKSVQVDVVVPTTYIDTHPDEQGRTRWSYCDARWARIRFKKSMADAAVDGIIPTGQLESDAAMTKKMLTWIHRLEDGKTVQIQRRRLKDELRGTPNEKPE